MMFAVSPFERVLGEAGGSLALAVSNGTAKWPEEKDGTSEYPFQELRRLCTVCLTVDMAQRPHAEEVLLLAQSIDSSS